MSHEKYTLEIVSQHPQFAKKSLRKYAVDGIETVGAWGDEPFEIRFKNNTFQKIQVKISLDGTDILSGKPADTEISKDMWVVNGYDTLTLKAWPEDNNGGAGFVFTSANNSVAAHTHGDMSSRGIIAAAVFVEGHVEPQRINLQSVQQNHHHYHYDKYPYYPYYQNGITYTPASSNYFLGSNRRCKGLQSSDNIVFNSSNAAGALGNANNSVSYNSSASMDSLEFGAASEIVEDCDSRSLESLVSVGAGEHVNQKITYVTGLVKPMFTETVRVKYLWWDDLVAKLRTQTVAQAQPSGFPGDANKKNIDLGGTPRIKGDRGGFRRSEPQMFSRV